MKFFFSFFPWKERTEGTSEKDYDRKKAKVPKSKNHRNELAHFCGFCFGDKAPSVPQWDYIVI